MRPSLILVGVLALNLVACRSDVPVKLPDVGSNVPQAARDVLENADSFEILALDPVHRDRSTSTPNEAEYLGDYRILGKATLSERQQQHDVVSLVYEGILDSDGRVAGCFNPRHGVRARRGKETVELIICYECLSMKIEGPAGAYKSALTARSVESTMTKLYTSKGLQISK